MARTGKQQGQANQLFDESQGVLHKSWGDEANLQHELQPEYESLIAGSGSKNPLQGTYTSMAKGEDTPGSIAENTAAQDSSGGATSAVFGEQGLKSARTHNSSASPYVLGETVRNAMRSNADTAARIKAANVNAGIKGEDELYHTGLSGEHSLYNTANANVLGSIGLGDKVIGTELDAKKLGDPFGQFMDVWKQLSQNAETAAKMSGGG